MSAEAKTEQPAVADAAPKADVEAGVKPVAAEESAPVRFLEQKPYSAYIVEFIGSVFLTAVAALAPAGVAPLAVGVALTALTYAGHHLSGAYFNPAAVFAALLHHRLKPVQALGYILLQFGGAFLGAGLASAVSDGLPLILAAQVPVVPVVPDMYNVGEAFFLSWAFSATFIWVLLSMSLKKKNNSYTGLGVGLTFTGLAFAMRFVSANFGGAVLNPAVSLATLAVHGNSTYLENSWIFVIAPFIGAIMAGLMGFFTFNRLPSGKPFFPTLGAVVAECWGTAIVTLVAGLSFSQPTGSPSVDTIAPVAVGGVYVGLTYAAQGISGAHFNPAVTFATLMSQSWTSRIRAFFNYKTALMYAVCQIVSAIVGGVIAGHYVADSAPDFRGNTGLEFPTVAYGQSDFQGFFFEAIFVGAIALIFLSVTTTYLEKEHSFSGLSVGFTYMAGFMSAGNWASPSLNPATAIGLILGADADGAVDAGIKSWLYIIAPFVGAFCGYVLYRMTNEGEYLRPTERRAFYMIDGPIWEGIGVFLLTLVISLTSSAAALSASQSAAITATCATAGSCINLGVGLQPVAIAGILVATMFAAGHVSGGHFNPAITFGIYMSGDGKKRVPITLPMTIAYMGMQLFGAIIGGVCAAYISLRSTPAVTFDDSGDGVFIAFLAEFLFGVLLVNSAIVTTFPKSIGGNSFAGLTVGFSLLGGIVATGAYTGAGLNPAVVLGLAASDNTEESRKYLWLHILAPMMGGLVSMLICRVTHEHEYEQDAEKRKFDAVVAPVQEFVGSFYLVLTAGLVYGITTAAKSNPFAAVATLGVYVTLMYQAVHVSGAHFNPVLTLAAHLVGKPNSSSRHSPVTLFNLVVYLCSQFAGGLCGASVAGVISGLQRAPYVPKNDNLGRAVATEIIFTTALVYVFLSAVYSRKSRPNSYYGIAVGFAVGAFTMISFPISGGAFNPIYTALTAVNGSSIVGEDAFIYWVGPLVGSMLGALFYRITNQQERTH